MTDYTTGHCEYNKRPGGCPHHNLHCGWPNCDRRPIESTPPSAASVSERAREWFDAYDHAVADLSADEETGWNEGNRRHWMRRRIARLRAILIAALEQALTQQRVAEWSDDLRAVLDAASEASQVPLMWLANQDFSPEQTKAWLCEAVDATVEEGAFSGSLHQVAEEGTGHVVAFTGCGPKSAANAKFLIWCVHFILKHRDALATTPQPSADAVREDSARLDWIESQIREYGDGYTEPREAGWGIQWQQERPDHYWPGLRAWIDEERRRASGDELESLLSAASGEKWVG